MAKANKKTNVIKVPKRKPAGAPSSKAIESKTQSRVAHNGTITVDYEAKGLKAEPAVITHREDAHYIETKSGFHGVVADGQHLPTGEVYDAESPIEVTEETDEESDGKDGK